MYDLCPPGTFPLCVDARFQNDAAQDLDHVSRQVRESLRRFSVEGLLLAGSVARGEGTLVADTESGSRWLGDLECILLLPTQSGSGQVERAVQDTVLELNKDLNSRRGLKVAVTTMVTNQFSRLRPSIFNREFLEHGKLLWGDPSQLSAPLWWRAGRRDIPLHDAFRLLNNRIIQQVTARVAQETGVLQPFGSEYSISKFWIELATSLSIFLGCYRSTYRQRQREIERALMSRPEVLGNEFRDLFITRLNEAMAVKFGQAPTPFGRTCQERFDEVARVTARVWYWESAQMLQAPPAGPDWRLVMRRLRLIEPAIQRARDWVRLLLRDKELRRLTPYTSNTLKAALHGGSLANTIYAGGCLLLFFWKEIGLDIEPGPEIARALTGLFGVTELSGKRRREALTKRVDEAWQRHLRFAAA